MAKKTWGVRGLSNPTPGGSKPPAPPAKSVQHVGQIPILSKLFVSARIRGAKKSIDKLDSKIENSVAKMRQKVDSIVAAAKRTDSARLIGEARELQDRLEEAACVEPEFRDTEGAAERLPSMTKEQKREVKVKCIRAANSAQGVLWKSGTGHGGDPKYPGWKDAFDACFREETE